MTDLLGRRVLVIEDEALIALLLESMLADLGCEIVGRAVTTGEALARIEADSGMLDAATVDVDLHGEKAGIVATALASRGIPFIVTTGYDDPALLTDFLGRPVVRKPILAIELEQALRSAFGFGPVAPA